MPFNHNMLLRLPSVEHTVYLFWSTSKTRAVYVGKTDRPIRHRMREHWRDSSNPILKTWIDWAADDLLMCYMEVPWPDVVKVERRMIRALDPIANDQYKR